jgi:hypothetical protein
MKIPKNHLGRAPLSGVFHKRPQREGTSRRELTLTSSKRIE